jgi:hypothetical protein
MESIMVNNNQLDVKLSVMGLNWNNPTGDNFITWLKEAKEAGYDGITGFDEKNLAAFIERP